MLADSLWTTITLGEIALVSGVMLVLGLISVPLLLVLIPRDYFITHEEYLSRWKSTRPLMRYFVLALRNLVGVILMILGVIMLFTPGQGMVIILLGLSCSSFPGKRTLELKILRQRGVLRSINWMRARMHRFPLKMPDSGGEPETKSQNEELSS